MSSDASWNVQVNAYRKETPEGEEQPEIPTIDKLQDSIERSLEAEYPGFSFTATHGQRIDK